MNNHRFLQIRMSPELFELVATCAWRRRQSLTAFAISLFEAYIEATGENPVDVTSEPADKIPAE